MKCDDADNYMMKYMDGELTQAEARLLNEHLCQCGRCKESFTIYDNLMIEFQDMPEFEAPEDFELKVMAQVTALSENAFEVRYRLSDKIQSVMLGGFTILFGTGTVLVAYREPILLSLSQNPYIGDMVQKFIPVSEHVTKQSEAIMAVVDGTITTASGALYNAMGILFALVAALCAVQFVMLRRKKKNRQG